MAEPWALASIAGQSLHRDAFWCTNSYVLLNPAPRRRTNRKAGGAPGRRGYPGVKDQRSDQLLIEVFGSHDPSGTPLTDQEQGVQDNVDWLIDYVYNATEDDRGTVAVEVLMKDLTVRSGRLQLDDCTTGPGVSGRLMKLDFTLPAGELELDLGS